MNKKIVIAHGHTSIEILHTITPFVLASKKDTNYKFKFINYKFKNIFRQQGDLLILIRKYHDGKLTDEKIIKELKKLRKNFTKIVYFDDSAAASIVFFVFPMKISSSTRRTGRFKKVYSLRMSSLMSSSLSVLSFNPMDLYFIALLLNKLS